MHSNNKSSNYARFARQSSKFIRERRHKNVLMVSLCIVATVSSIFALSQFTRLGIFNIERIEIIGVAAVDAEALQAASLQAIQGDYLGLFPRSHILLYPEKAIATAIRSVSERVRDISINRKGLRSLTIVVEEKSPAALICANLPDWDQGTLIFGESEDCYFADASGNIYDRAPLFLGDVYNRYYIPEIGGVSSGDSIIGRSGVPETEFKDLQKFYGDVRMHDITTHAILIRGGGEYELYVSNPRSEAVSSSTADNVAVVYFNERNGFDNQLGNLTSLWSNMVGKARARGETVRFRSIDLRYGSNVFYRLNAF